MKERKFLRDQKGFALLGMILGLVIVCILAALAIPKYLSPDKDKVQDNAKNAAVSGTPGVTADNVRQDDARNAAGLGALGAATSNVQMAYAKLLVNNTSGTTVSNAAVVTLLNSCCTSVGDYVVSYSTSGSDRVTATLQASSKGKFGSPNSKEIPLIR
jgi:competence protein ComGC